MEVLHVLLEELLRLREILFVASVFGRLQDHGVIALGIHPLSGIEVVNQFLIVTLRRTSQGVSRKHLSTVCVKSIAAKISLIRLLTTSE